jgi:Tol biopolymer transport system component
MRPICIFVLLLFPSLALAQGFNSFSGRNHPENKWMVAETAHFKLMYPQHLTGIEAEAASVAEATYEALSKNLDVSFKSKIPLYFSDEDEITNGFATPLGGYSCIWVNVNDFASVWTGEVKWMRKVLSHELTHLFLNQALKGTSTLLSVMEFPRHLNEGLAQYQTERWDSERGDRWVRTAILEDRPNFEDGASAWNGRLLYAVGNAQLRFMATQYGDSSIVKLLKFRKKNLFGKQFDFEEGFQKATGKSYAVFSEEWRRFVNIYYNTMASRQESPDSLAGKRLSLPAQYISDAQISPVDTSVVAFIGFKSLSEPYSFLATRSKGQVKTLAEGSINEPLAWSPDGKKIAFSRNGYVANGALINDLFAADLQGKVRRLTTNRRAVFPSFSPDGKRLAFVASSGKTANVFLLQLDSMQETQLTHFTGDVQINGLVWHPQNETLALSYFDAEGKRPVALVAVPNAEITPLTDGTEDFRSPVWSPDGKKLALTGLKDEVPNVFIFDIEAKSWHRVTRLSNGGSALAWARPDSLNAQGKLLLKVSTTKRQDRVYAISALKTAKELHADVPASFTAWRTHQPPNTIPYTISPNEALIEKRETYRPLRNIKKLLVFALPFYTEKQGASILGAGTFSEPLGKHQFAFSGNLSVIHPSRSAFYLNYTNNQFRPSLAFQIYQSEWISDKLYAEDQRGIEAKMTLPVDKWYKPYTATLLEASVRLRDRKPILDGNDLFSADFFYLHPPNEFIPQRGLAKAGKELDFSLTFGQSFLHPNALNGLQPTQTHGLRATIKGAVDVNGTNSRYLRPDVEGYIAKGIFGGSIFAYGRALMQWGKSLPQDFVGLSPTNGVSFGMALPVSTSLGNHFRFGDAIAVRGVHETITGNQMGFGTVEFQLPAFDLNTTILGLLSLRNSTLSAFADGAWVNDSAIKHAETRFSYGLELKNSIGFSGFNFVHALGYAWTSTNLPTFYYRIQAAIPF